MVRYKRCSAIDRTAPPVGRTKRHQPTVAEPFTYHGAKNLMNTVLPSVTSWKLSLVSSTADADDAAATRARKNDACLLIAMISIAILEGDEKVVLRDEDEVLKNYERDILMEAKPNKKS
jgi:hypothetical protein